MKKINEMTIEEKIALKDDEIKSMIHAQLAEEGVKIVLEKPKELEKIVPKQSLVIFKVNDKDFTVEASARKFKKCLEEIANDLISTTYIGNEYSFRQVANYKADKTFPLNEDVISTKEEAEDYTNRKAKAGEVYKLNKELQDEYDQYRNAYDNIYRDIYNEIGEAHTEMYNRKKYFDIIDEYIKIAHGDRILAKNFFTKAYLVDSSMMQYLNENCFLISKTNNDGIN